MRVFEWEKSERGDEVLKATFEADGFDVVARVKYDYDHDFADCRGQFKREWKPGALKYRARVHEHGVFEWFWPEYTVREMLKDALAAGKSIQEARKDAAELAYKEMRRAADGYDLTAVFVEVSVWSKVGIRVGRCAIFGIEVESLRGTDLEYIAETADDCLSEALDEARKNMRELAAEELNRHGVTQAELK